MHRYGKAQKQKNGKFQTAMQPQPSTTPGSLGQHMGQWLCYNMELLRNRTTTTLSTGPWHKPALMWLDGPCSEVL